MIVVPCPEVIFGSVNIDPNGIYLQSLTRAADSFSADFKNDQAYWQIDTRLTDTIRISSGYVMKTASNWCVRRSVYAHTYSRYKAD